LHDVTGSPRPPAVDVTAARNAVALVFAANGFAFASWVARIPQAREALHLSPGSLGATLLALSAGSVVALPSAGVWVHRFGAAAVVGCAALLDAVGVAVTGLGAGLLGDVWVTVLGLFLLGFGSGVWDVAMNVEGAEVERRLGRTVMPRFHAGWSLGTVAGAACGAAAAASGVPIQAHLALTAVLVAGLALWAVRTFLPHEPRRDPEERPRHALRAWGEGRTLLIGVLVLTMALTEGVANDWLAVGLVDGYDVPAWLGASGFALFVAAMTTGRVTGTVLLDRFGRLRVLWGSMVLAGAGVLLVVYGGMLALVAVGVVLWGVGASLGFPVGMSAAADDPVHAAARVSVVSTVGYAAFLAGPPLLGFLGDHVGVLHALLVVAVLLVPATLTVPAARPLER
jgi:MFS family permease